MEIGIASRPKPGETVCGDSHLVKHENGVTLIAVVDGLGHGELASEAAEVGIGAVEKNYRMEVTDIIRSCHEAMRRTRGGVIGLTRIDTARDRLEFAGVGNIEFRSISANGIKPISMSGIIGYNMRKVKKFEYDIVPGDLISMFSDGVSSRIDLEDYAHHDPERMAEAILEDHGNDADDATIIIARY